MRCLAVAGFAAMNIMLLSVSVWSGSATDMTPETRDFFHWLSALIALPAAAYAGQPFFRSAWRALRARQLNMDVPISLGVMLALGMSVVETRQPRRARLFRFRRHAAVLPAVRPLSRPRHAAQDARGRRQSRRAEGRGRAPLRGRRRSRDGAGRGAQAGRPPAGAAGRARAGRRRRDLSGTSEIDESLVTGETARRPVAAGAAIYAGSLNFSGALTVRVTAAGADTLIDEVERLLEKAVAAQLALSAARRPRRALLRAGRARHRGAHRDRLARSPARRSTMPIVTAIAVLIITCPCALALAIPAVQVVASGALFRARRHPQCRRRHRAAGRGRHRRVRQDRHAHAAGAARRQCRRASIRTCSSWPARLALSSRHPLAAAVAREARDRDAVSKARSRSRARAFAP